MPSFLFHLQIKSDCQQQALETLAAIQRAARRDEGCLSFTWFRHKNDPSRFTMHERWRTEDALNAHKAKGADIWAEFVSCLVGDPVSEELEPVADVLQSRLTQAEVSAFVQTWYEKLSRRASVEQLLSMVANLGLEMRFPDCTIRNHDQFRSWYANVGENYDQQEHVVERVSQLESEQGLLLFVTVVWRARSKSDGSRVAMRANQTWTIGHTQAVEQPTILTYAVNSLSNV